MDWFGDIHFRFHSKEFIMKRLFFLSILVLGLTSALFAWKYSAQTTWNGSHHVDGSTNFTPGSTTVYVSMCSPDQSSAPCPDYIQDPYVYCLDYLAKAKLVQGGNTYFTQRQCGGNAYNTRTLTTAQSATIIAQIEETCVTTPFSGMGPVTAYAGNPQTSCFGAGPGE
jgi:hypothetical protein